MAVTVTVTESPAGRRLVPRAPRRLVPLAVAAMLVFLLFPVQRRIDGVGIVQPVFERLVIVRPEWGGMVTRVEARRFDRVEIGTPLFEFAREREYAMLVRSGGALRDDESQPLRAVEERRAARMEAVRAWIPRASSPPATGWERQIATWVRERAHTESAYERLVAMLGDGERRGGAGAGEVRAVDHAAGRRAPARDGGPFPSPAAGTIVSLWVAPRMQLGGYVVAEVMPDGTPIEVLGLVPLRAVDAVASGDVRAWVRAGKDVPASTAAAPVRASTSAGLRCSRPRRRTSFPASPPKSRACSCACGWERTWPSRIWAARCPSASRSPAAPASGRGSPGRPEPAARSPAARTVLESAPCPPPS